MFAKNYYRRFFKPILDWVLACCLLLLLWPLFLVIAILIKLDSRGTVFFKQERLGKNGKVFMIFKFRTMVDNAITMGTGLRTYEKDPRITRIGRILRKTSLDELPQLFNVLRGEMSFIGPRPPVPYFPFPYEEYDATEKNRFNVKPGITGYAQIVFRKNSIWKQRFVYDVRYVESVGFFLDTWIFFVTLYKIVSPKDVYANPSFIASLEQSSELSGVKTLSKSPNPHSNPMISKGVDPMSNEFRIQQMFLTDAINHFDRIVDLLQELYDDQRKYNQTMILNRQSCELRCEKLIEYLRSDTALLWGGFVESELAGFLWGYEREFFGKRQMHIFYVVVAESLRGQGMGSRLLDAATAESRQRGLSSISLFCLANKHDVLHFYDMHGFDVARCQLIKTLGKD